jgi:NAD(P)-dependent dehydrogenase (short-subunit alcohol dehydrogenase family)
MKQNPTRSGTAEPTVRELFDLTGRVALVTGASGHLGSAMARGLAEAGCQVIVASRKSSTGKKAAQALGSLREQPPLHVVLDQMDEGSIKRGFKRALKMAGHIDILVNSGHEVLTEDWRGVTGAQFTRQLANATGCFLLARLVRDDAVNLNAPASIIMLGSMYGQVASYPDVYAGISPANPAAYQMLKGGIIQLTRHLAVYWAKDRVRVNCLSPGPFPASAASPNLVTRLRAKSPMNRNGQPHELKGAIVFLASDASSYVTGQNLVVDGGWTAW